MVYTVIRANNNPIGQALARECAIRGKNLILMSSADTFSRKWKADLSKEYDISIEVFDMELGRDNSFEGFKNWLDQDNNEIDTLINCPGELSFSDLFEEHSYSSVQNMMNSSMKHLISLIQFLVPYMQSETQSFILNVGYISSYAPVPRQAIPSATMGFIQSFSNALSYEFNESNLSISYLGIVPDIQSQQNNNENRGLLSKLFKSDSEAIAEEAIDRMLMGDRVIIPGACNRVVVWLGKHLPTYFRMNLYKHLFS